MKLKRASAQKSGIQEKIGKTETQDKGAALHADCRQKQQECLDQFSYHHHITHKKEL